MKQRHHTPEQVIRKLAEGEKLLGQGQTGQAHEECRPGRAAHQVTL
jgi:hypothetical protein